ncbi:MAG: rubredoxin [Nitrococcus sp.]|nr:rubredoxin [Nitrococcus sp.]
MCTACGWIYDESKGVPAVGIAPGTRWEDVPDAFLCQEFGEGKDVFERIEA